MYFAKNIKLLRKRAKMTQTDLGDMIGVSYTAIVTYEAGRGTPKFEGLLKIAEIFNVNVHDLIYKDLSDPNYKASGPEDTGELVKALESRVRALESVLKLSDPELAKRLGIE